jgi:hypothetical protein
MENAFGIWWNEILWKLIVKKDNLKKIKFKELCVLSRDEKKPVKLV